MSKLARFVFEGTGFDVNIEDKTLRNNYFREVLFTADNMQLVVMTVIDEIGMEVHNESDQFIRIESGTGEAMIGGRKFPIEDGSAFIIPKGTRHNVMNTGIEPLKLYAIYSPPHHPEDRVDKDKPEEENEV